MFIILLEITFFIISVYSGIIIYQRYIKFSDVNNKIDGPPMLPLIGNLHQFFDKSASKLITESYILCTYNLMYKWIKKNYKNNSKLPNRLVRAKEWINSIFELFSRMTL